ncbi:type II toxin-antitoxin system PemK/MazF family toxin [Yinghuangia sp. ASG 101]|uniref:type II toxin-antitoxin system PemK/MazF family toxin n=1 Tax=Yinghuangia sp. ASG 101 TaxID=2896848 RepID=UPI001E2D1FC5|nr:type II toxin-antitoxin system PemK/MazF family toxin [Yinghuangia sp. ASG 101]UGQ10078.1 type II toxin-antitoxin system PemK/MazF family toxin [Yinghuangia sp. ASG 101]
MKDDYHPGDIVLVDLEPSVSGQQGGKRPALVLSASSFNNWPIGLVVIVPITSRDTGFAHHVRVGHDGGLDRPSWAMPEYMRSVTQRRIARLIAQADEATLLSVRVWVDRILGR